jgi:hypothetical protein
MFPSAQEELLEREFFLRPSRLILGQVAGNDVRTNVVAITRVVETVSSRAVPTSIHQAQHFKLLRPSRISAHGTQSPVALR